MNLVHDMIPVSLRDIKQGYRGLKKIAQKSVKEGDFYNGMVFIARCTTVASQFNWIYADDELEELLDTIAKSKIDSSFASNYEPDENHWVFFDDYCTSYVLALQWMRALSKFGKKILYITARTTLNNPQFSNVLDVIKKTPNVTVEVVPSVSTFERANHLFRLITGFNASKLFLHKAMYSIIQLPLCVLPEKMKVYNINLGDQFFWLGRNNIDYNIEFRPFGASVSLQKRGFRKEQLLMVPFYPIDDGNPFEGFPEGCQGKTVIFSGGDYYKTFDEKGTYWRLVKSVLDKHPDVVFLFATKRDNKDYSDMAKFVADNHFEGRFIHSEFRKDIYQVFAHCDIYMGTTPVSGSLMSQLAAINGKPILQYYAPGTPDDETEQALCVNDKFQISYHSEKEFLDEADKLINDAEYRKKQGQRLKNAMIQPDQFDELVRKTLSANESQFPLDAKPIDNKILEKRWLVLEKVGLTQVKQYLYSTLGKTNCLRYAPGLYIKIRANRIWKKA